MHGQLRGDAPGLFRHNERRDLAEAAAGFSHIGQRFRKDAVRGKTQARVGNHRHRPHEPVFLLGKKDHRAGVQMVDRAPQAAFTPEPQLVPLADIHIVNKTEGLLSEFLRIGNDNAPFPFRPEPVFKMIAQFASPDIS